MVPFDSKIPDSKIPDSKIPDSKTTDSKTPDSKKPGSRTSDPKIAIRGHQRSKQIMNEHYMFHMCSATT